MSTPVLSSARAGFSRAAVFGCVVGLFALAASTGSGRASEEEPLRHLGDSQVADWAEFSAQPEGREWSFPLPSEGEAAERALLLTHQDVDERWELVVNGTAVAELERVKARGERPYTIPGKALKPGANTLLVRPVGSHADDILVGRPKLLPGSFREAFQLATLVVRVREEQSGAPLPARLGLFDRGGKGAELFRPRAQVTAVRPGLAYTPDGEFEVEVPAGDYSLHATRGIEWSHAQRDVALRFDQRLEVELKLRRELDTRGWIAADTHIHTFGPTNHGDALLDERLASLAGEGVELAVATDHNHVTDFAPRQTELGLTRHFTPVVGNEVTTSLGHFNAFPFAMEGRLPDSRETDWVKLVADIRAQGAEVVVLNHPRWPGPFEDAPFHLHGLDRVSGERASGTPYSFDCMELANATDPKDDPLLLVRDWFALLNRGETIRAVGTSDSHTLLDPVGQGRTYLPSATDDPARIDVAAACTALREGRGSVSMGIFSELVLDGRARMGDVHVPREERLALRLRVAAPSWITARKAHVFVNGEQVAERALEDRAGPLDAWLDFEVARPPHDAWLVCVVYGDDVAGEFWPNAHAFTLAATNPVFVDVEGDGWKSPRALAEELVATCAADAAAPTSALRACDAAVAVQALAVLRLQDHALDLGAIAGAAGQTLARAWLESR